LIKGYVDFYPFLSACVSSLFSFALLAFRPDYAFIFFLFLKSFLHCKVLFWPHQGVVGADIEQHVIFASVVDEVLLVMGLNSPD